MNLDLDLPPGLHRRYFIDLGLKHTISALFSNPEWSRQRGQHRSKDKEGSWWCGTEVERLRAYARDNPRCVLMMRWHMFG